MGKAPLTVQGIKVVCFVNFIIMDYWRHAKDQF